MTLWSTPHGTRPSGEPGNLLSALYLEKPFVQSKPINGGPPNYAADRNGIPLYEFAGTHVRTHFVEKLAARASSTRGLGAYGNVFAIESFIDDMDGVDESAVIGIPHPDFGEAVMAVVVPKAGAKLNAEAMIATLKTQIANFKIPKRVEIVADLPRNAMGKVQKNILRQQYTT